MILYQVGSLAFEPYPFALMGYTREAGADFASKDVIGTLKPKEAVGEGDEQITFTGVLTPYHFGGLENLDVLDAMRIAQDPIPVLRGDGRWMGYYVVEKVGESHEEKISADGIGLKIVVTVTISLVPDPSDDAQASQLLSLF